MNDIHVFFFSQGELINNIERNVTTAAEYVDRSKDETSRAVDYKKNPYKITFRPNFMKSLKKNSAPDPVWAVTTPNVLVCIEVSFIWFMLPVCPSGSFLKDFDDEWKEFIW